MLLSGEVTIKRLTKIVLPNWGTKEAVMGPIDYFKIANRKYTLILRQASQVNYTAMHYGYNVDISKVLGKTE